MVSSGGKTKKTLIRESRGNLLFVYESTQDH
jgi:hypothetical protein